MRTKEENIALIKQIMLDFGIKVDELLEEKTPENAPQVSPRFLDIQKINGIPCLYLRCNKITKKHEWLCLNHLDKPETPWEEGKIWYQSNSDDRGEQSTLRFISDRIADINEVLKAQNFNIIDNGRDWSAEDYLNYLWLLYMDDVSNNKHYKTGDGYIREITFC